jgi:glycosyltransferase involved in cell wall biosynthesis
MFTPGGGGTVDLVYKLSKALVTKGHEVELYAGDYLWDQSFADTLPEVKIRTFHDYSRIGGMYFTPGMAAELDKRIREFDIVHLHCMRSYQNILVHHYAKKYGVPYILDTHGSLPRKVVGEFIFKTPIRWLFDITFGDRILRDACQVVAETELGVNEYKKFGISRDMIALIPPPFDTEQFAVLPTSGLFKKRFNLESKKLITFLGRIHQIKGFDFLVKSFSELARNRDDVILVIAGNDDGYKSTLDSLISSLGISDKVLYTGFLKGDEKLGLLVDSDIVAQTSVYEQGAWAPIEAVLCGTPIIVTGHTGAGEDVKRMDAGYLVEYDNVPQMVQLITKILDNPVEAKTKAKNAAAYVRTHMSIEKRIIDYENLYKSCIENQQ